MAEIDHRQRDLLIEAIQRAALQSDKAHLTFVDFQSATLISMNTILKHFDTWREACNSAGVSSGSNGPENLTPKFSKGRDHALQELKRVAAQLGIESLSKSQYDSQKPEVKSCTVASLFSGWKNALKAAELQRSELFRDPIELENLAMEFLFTYRELNRIPTVRQVVRRSKHCLNTFTRKFGSYSSFKIEAIRFLLQKQNLLSSGESTSLAGHLTTLTPDSEPSGNPVAVHHRGRHLGFRAFAFAPTYETEVVALFAAVAEELGFELVAQRPAFPDCEARRLVDKRRRRYESCLIEFELKSSDYRRHSHPLAGCDLIVCWEHDWLESPLEVLDLSQEIRKLPGWK